MWGTLEGPKILSDLVENKPHELALACLSPGRSGYAMGWEASSDDLKVTEPM